MKTTIGIFLIALSIFFAWEVFSESQANVAQNESDDPISAKVTNTSQGMTDENQTSSAQNIMEGEVIESKIDKQDLSSYGDSFLEELVQNGDVEAMKVLALRYIARNVNERDVKKRNHNVATMDQLLSKAILYGDRQTLYMMPELAKETFRLISKKMTEEERLDVVLNIMSYHEFMALRGSAADKYDQQIMFYDTYRHLGLPTGLSDDDKNIVRERAKKFYDQMEQKRIELGLGPFDNSIPASIQKDYEMQRERYLSKLGPLAIE